VSSGQCLLRTAANNDYSITIYGRSHTISEITCLISDQWGIETKQETIANKMAFGSTGRSQSTPLTLYSLLTFPGRWRTWSADIEEDFLTGFPRREGLQPRDTVDMPQVINYLITARRA